MVWASLRVLVLGWVDEFYVEPAYHFTWELFPWVAPLPPVPMRLLFVIMAVLAAGVAAGFRYRLSAALFTIAFTYVELIDKTTYLNHYYLVSLLSGLLAVVPAHRLWSIDAWRRKRAAAVTPAWTVNVFRLQLAVVYVYAGLAKINADWLLVGQPLRTWLAARSDVPVIGGLFLQPSVSLAFGWAGMLYDLTIVLFLVWFRTRAWAYASVCLFHLLTWLLFPIGMFPWIMIVATTIFFPPAWPRRFARRSVPRLAGLPASPAQSEPASRRTLALLGAYVFLQVVIPLRAYWPGTQPEWSNRGFNFAWRVMVAEKAGAVDLIAHDPREGTQWSIPIRDYLSARQERMMAQDPFMIRAFARHVASDYARSGRTGLEIHADAFVALNGRPMQRLIDPKVDLAATDAGEWIVPLVNADGDEPQETAVLRARRTP